LIPSELGHEMVHLELSNQGGGEESDHYYSLFSPCSMRSKFMQSLAQE
jgi:hypothetical protein